MQIELTNEEATVLMNLINVALQAKGFEAFDAAGHFRDKIKAAAQAEADAAKEPK